MFIKTLSDHAGQGQLKYDDNASAKFGRNYYLNQNVATVPEEKKQFKCDICNTNFRKKAIWINMLQQSMKEKKNQM